MTDVSRRMSAEQKGDEDGPASEGDKDEPERAEVTDSEASEGDGAALPVDTNAAREPFVAWMRS